MGLNGFGFGEVILIAMLVLIVFGPKRLPEVIRTLGKVIREFKKGMNEIQRELDTAGREVNWQSPPAPPKPPAQGATPRATVAAKAQGAGDTVKPHAAEESGSESTASDGLSAMSADPSQVSAPAAKADGVAADPPAAAPDAESATTYTIEPPPVPRGGEDPAAEFIDPWSGDPPRSSFGQPVVKPSSGPDLPAADGGDGGASADDVSGGDDAASSKPTVGGPQA